jgi:hypothetical protein
MMHKTTKFINCHNKGTICCKPCGQLQQGDCSLKGGDSTWIRTRHTDCSVLDSHHSHCKQGHSDDKWHIKRLTSRRTNWFSDSAHLPSRPVVYHSIPEIRRRAQHIPD